ncbi:MAG: hypothetical protein M1608_02560 [Candidatus Omnitrophica bacterium]|nr:hypothetical protein [Candidatus Omnitrophota bacterium]
MREELEKDSERPLPAAPDPLVEKLRVTRERLREHRKRQMKLARELEVTDSLTSIIHRVRENLSGYGEDEVVKIVPENESVQRVIKQLFPMETRVTTKEAAFQRVDRYLEKLAVRKAKLLRQLGHCDQLVRILSETEIVTRQLQKLKRERRKRVGRGA